MKKTILLILVLVFVDLSVNSQNTNRVLNSFQQETNATVKFQKNIPTPSLVSFPANNSLSLKGKSIEDKVANFLATNQSIYAINSTDQTLSDGVTKTDNYGFKHHTLKQHYKGVPVYDGQLKFHFDKNENLRSINGTIISDISLDAKPRLNKQQAGEIAVELVKNQNINASSNPLKTITNELFIFPKGLVQGVITSKHLAYRIEVRNDVDVREYLFIDAKTGKLVEQFTGMAHALDRVLYEGDTSDQRWTEGNLFPGFLNPDQRTLISSAGHIYHLFNNTFGFDSYDGNGAQMITISNDETPDFCPNASWNGVNTSYCEGVISDDVVAHEWGHAYTDGTNDLIYAFESGALNEAYSDIWGETVDLLNSYNDDGEDLSLRTSSNSSLRWKMGEDTTLFGAIRDLWDPTFLGDPGKVSDSNFVCGADNDGGGVHSNSGIANHLYALLVDGGTYNGQTISALGFTKAAHIFWRTQSEYLTFTSDFGVFADAIEAAATDLIGTNLEGLTTTETPAGPSGQIITSADVANITKALLATELRDDNACDYATLLDTDTPAICGAASSNPIFSEDWESGLGNWVVTQHAENASWESREWTIATGLPDNRTGSGIFAPNPRNGDCDTSLQNGIIRLESPTITIPNYTSGTFELAFNHSVASEKNYDGGNLKYSIDGGAWTLVPAASFTQNPYNLTLNNSNNDSPMSGEIAFSGSDDGGSLSVWGQSIVDLSSMGITANKTLKLRWEFGSDGCNGVDGWYVDEIVVYNCSESLSVADINSVSDILSIYPNPSQGVFNLKLKNVSNISFDLYDITGKTIMSKVPVNRNEFTLDLNQYQKGMYFMKIKSDYGTTTKKLVIQ